MHRIILIIVMFMGSAAVSGCACFRVVPEPGKITLQQALEDVGVGLNKMYEAGKDKPKTGLVPSEVTVVFNISASAKVDGKLFVEAGAPTPDTLKIIKAGGDIAPGILAARGNTVTIKFTNLLLTNVRDSLIMLKTPSEITTLLSVLKKAEYEPIMKAK